MDLKLLSSCPVLIGTFYSSYSETAKLLSGAFYVQVPRAPHPLQGLHLALPLLVL